MEKYVRLRCNGLAPTLCPKLCEARVRVPLVFSRNQRRENGPFFIFTGSKFKLFSFRYLIVEWFVLKLYVLGMLIAPFKNHENDINSWINDKHLRRAKFLMSCFEISFPNWQNNVKKFSFLISLIHQLFLRKFEYLLKCHNRGKSFLVRKIVSY